MQGIATVSSELNSKIGLSNGEAPTTSGIRIGGENLQEGPSVRVRDAMLSISGALQKGRKTIWDLSARRVVVLLSCEALCTTSPHQFLQSLDCVTKFILAGEAFCGVEAMTLRAKLVKQSEKYYWSFHQQNLDVSTFLLCYFVRKLQYKRNRLLYDSFRVTLTTNIFWCNRSGIYLLHSAMLNAKVPWYF